MRSAITLQRYSLSLFFLLTLGLTWLLWIPAGLLLAGDEEAAFSAPIIVVQTVGAAMPSLVAIALVRLLYGRRQLRELFGRVRIWRGDRRWYAIAILLAPLLAACSLGIRAWTTTLPWPRPPHWGSCWQRSGSSGCC
jgi:uncharacterized protein